MVRTCMGEVCVRRSCFFPLALVSLILSVIQKVSHTSRAGWLSGILSLSKLCCSSSIWGPSSTLNPSEIKISSKSSEVILIGCLCPFFFDGNWSVTSICSSSTCCSNFASSSKRVFSSAFCSISFLSSLARGPTTFFSSTERYFHLQNH